MSIRPILYFVPQLNLPEAWTASGDGSTYKGVISVAHFATFPPVPSTNEANGEVNCVPRRRFLGATREVNHKTSTQLENWIGLHVDIASVNNESPGGSKDPIKATEIGRKATGYSADHAADQLKLSRELCAHKLSCDHQLRGEEAIKLKSEGEIKEVVDQKFCDILAEISDWKGWETHSREDQEKLFERLINEVHIHFGKLALAELPERLQRIAGLWRWSGCCMHKDLNTFKGGAVRLSAFWKKARLKGPVKLLSREKEEREELGIGTTDHEPNKSSGGAAKLADLVGALIRNRDETKGCPDKFRTYSWDHLGYEISFPDTSNTRYQCYGEAATELIQRLDFYTDFLIQHGKSKRRAAGLNHMEMNILKGLMDPMTHTELAVFALYSEAISRPYAATVRGSFNEHKNALDLGPIHLQIITHIDILIGNPDLLIGDHTSYETGALYRTRWEDAVINHIHSIRDRLPHLRQALVAFLRGARVKWVDFTKEFSDGSAIANSTAEERLLSHRSPTNDHSEGAVASNNGWSRHAPSMKTHQKNARLFIQLNGPDIETFFHELPEPDRAFARKKAREMDAAKLPAKEREAQARANREAVEEEQREAARLKEHRETKEAEECRMIDGFQPILDLEAFLLLPDDKPSNDFLKRQLVWHRRVGRDKTLPSGTFSRMSKGPMKKLVVEALTRWTQGETGDVTIVDLGSENTEDSCAKTTTAEEDDYDHDFPQGTLATRSQSPTSKISHCDPLAIPGGRSLLPANFGCEWDPVNYSCLYDCLFTTFTWIYLHAPRTWQEKWTQESAIASFLSDHFEKVSSALSGSTPDHTVPALFTEGRDAWRDKISQRYPVEFPRRGPEYASIIQMLGVLADDRNPTHYATIILSCGTPGCPVRMKNLRPRPYMLLPSDWNTATGRTSPPHHESLETWIKAHYSSPHLSKTADRCTQCQQCFSRELVFREPTWIWFEIFPQFRHVILPAFKISLGSATLRLAAAMYYDGNHYRARLCDPSEAWWFYDGQWYGGRPTPIPKITDERDLFQCGSDFNITALVYCLADW